VRKTNECKLLAREREKKEKKQIDKRYKKERCGRKTKNLIEPEIILSFIFTKKNYYYVTIEY
jgi:hypothetical protein